MNPYDSPTVLNEACTHKVATHVHGTHVCYVQDRCRCQPCHQANLAYEKHRRGWLGEFPYRPAPYVDATPARQHLEALVAAGMGSKRIAQVSGMSHGHISKILYGWEGDPRSVRIRRATADRILTIDLDVADGAKVDATEANAIVRELVARGWTKAAIGRRVTGPHAVSLQAVESPLVMAGTLRTLRDLLYEPVPQRAHPRGMLYDADTGHRADVEPSTPGVPDVDRPFPDWLRQLDIKRLWETYEASRRAA